MVQKLGKNVTNHLSVNQLFQFTVQSIFCMILEIKISQLGIKHIEFQIAQRGEWFDPFVNEPVFPMNRFQVPSSHNAKFNLSIQKMNLFYRERSVLKRRTHQQLLQT